MEKYTVTENGCWNWNGARVNSWGHGSMRVKGKHYLAHRWYYQQLRGDIPEGMHIHHECRNASCVNPDHMMLITPSEHARLHFKKHLSEEQKNIMRELRGTMHYTKVAKEVGICKSRVLEFYRTF